jgi:hypothetical protein
LRQSRRQLAILEGESLGDIQKRAQVRLVAQACGLLPHLLDALWSKEQDGPLATAGLASS